MQALIFGSPTGAPVEGADGEGKPLPIAMARIDDVFVTSMGPEAEPLLALVVQRRPGQVKMRALTADHFAPLHARAGFFAAVDTGLMIGAAPATRKAVPRTRAAARRSTAGSSWAPGRKAIDWPSISRCRRRCWPPRKTGPKSRLASSPAPEDAEPESSTKASPAAEDEAIVPDPETTLPKRLVKVEPIYPESFRLAGLEGTVILQAVVSREGTVDEVHALRCSGHRVADDSSSERRSQLVVLRHAHRGRDRRRAPVALRAGAQERRAGERLLHRRGGVHPGIEVFRARRCTR